MALELGQRLLAGAHPEDPVARLLEVRAHERADRSSSSTSRSPGVVAAIPCRSNLGCRSVAFADHGRDHTAAEQRVGRRPALMVIAASARPGSRPACRLARPLQVAAGLVRIVPRSTR